MSEERLRVAFDHFYKVVGRVEHRGRPHLLARLHGSEAHRLFPVGKVEALEAQLAHGGGSVDALVDGGRASRADLAALLWALYRTATPMTAPKKAIEAHRILARLRDLQREKEDADDERRRHISNEINRLSLALDAVDAS